jgi:hypothetical protein
MKTRLVALTLLPCALAVAGPAVAWDLTTEAPRAKLPSPWPCRRPWTGAGARVSGAAMDMARLYLPRATPAGADDEAPAPATGSSATGSPAAASSTARLASSASVVPGVGAGALGSPGAPPIPSVWFGYMK